jgi:Tol biopolymer transport system component
MYDVATKKKRVVFNGAGQFSILYQNASFSPDSTRFLCLGLTAEKKERVAISFKIDGNDPDLKRHVEKGPTVWAKMAWHPKEPRIVFAMASPEHGTTQLFECNPNTSDEPKYIRGQETKFDNKSPFWSPDGKRLYCVGRLHDGKPFLEPTGKGTGT